MRSILVHGFLAGVLVLACSSSDDSSTNGSGGSTGSSGGSTGSSGGSGFKSCPPASGTTGSCSAADFEPYQTCVTEKCDSVYKQCYGADYKSGKFSGACGTYIECVQKCDCNDTKCFSACKPDSACTECSKGFGTCSSGCTIPACATEGSSSGGTTSGTCADLQACCDAIADADQKSGCQQAKDAANGNDSTCGQYYSGFKSAGLCP